MPDLIDNRYTRQQDANPFARASNKIQGEQKKLHSCAHASEQLVTQRLRE